jgi:uncharacterized protein (DUF433 family)
MDAERGAFDRITVDPAKMNGQPCIRDLRLTVRRVLEGLGTYASREDLRADYPELEDEDPAGPGLCGGHRRRRNG